MAYRMEDLIRGSMRGGLIFGYVPAHPSHASPAAYLRALADEADRLKAKDLVAETCFSPDLEVLDEARTAPGISLCGLFADRLSALELERVLACVTSDERPFFTPRYRTDTAKRRKKAQDLLSKQRGSLFELFPEVHQDFVLVITHEPRIANLLRLSSHASSPLFDYRHHHRTIDLG